ncbi:MAG: RnfABCDGE type electron transport complex subunit D [bacterium]|nr:RnfABCDGE type electron transport complex subunit D [bacterium]
MTLEPGSGPDGVPTEPAIPVAEPITPRDLIVSASPHVHAGQDVPWIMRQVLLALLPGLLAGLWFFGLGALRVLVLAVAGCLACEWACARLVKRPATLRDYSAVVTGVLLAMNLPSGSPWWLVLIGSVVAIGLGKAVYGGLGYNPFNPALVARVFLLISFPVQMTTWVVPQGPGTALDAATGATPLGAIKEAVGLGRTVADAGAPGLRDLLLGNVGGSFGEVSALALLLGGLWLLWRGVIRWQVPVAFMAVTALVTGIAHLADPAHYASPLVHLLGGGLMLGAWFMATDMVTSPVTRRGLLIFGAGCGLLTAVIRLWGGYPEGVSFAILLMNAATPLIDRWTRPRVFGEARKLYREADAA